MNAERKTIVIHCDLDVAAEEIDALTDGFVVVVTAINLQGTPARFAALAQRARTAPANSVVVPGVVPRGRG